MLATFGNAGCQIGCPLYKAAPSKAIFKFLLLMDIKSGTSMVRDYIAVTLMPKGNLCLPALDVFFLEASGSRSGKQDVGLHGQPLCVLRLGRAAGLLPIRLVSCHVSGDTKLPCHLNWSLGSQETKISMTQSGCPYVVFLPPFLPFVFWTRSTQRWKPRIYVFFSGHL